MSMSPRYAWPVGVALLIALPFVYRDPYHLHILILILIWSFAYTSWSMMGRFGLVSLGHGGFMGVGAYVTALLWNHLGVSPWLGIPVAMIAAAVLAVIVAYPCFRFRITGHYFVPLPWRCPESSCRSLPRPATIPAARLDTRPTGPGAANCWRCNSTRR